MTDSEFADYSTYSPDGVTPSWDEHTVTIDGVDMPAYQLHVMDGLLAIEIDIAPIDEYKGLPTSPVEISTPLESFRGKITHVQIEEGLLTLWVTKHPR